MASARTATPAWPIWCAVMTFASRSRAHTPSRNVRAIRRKAPDTPRTARPDAPARAPDAASQGAERTRSTGACVGMTLRLARQQWERVLPSSTRIDTIRCRCGGSPPSRAVGLWMAHECGCWEKYVSRMASASASRAVSPNSRGSATSMTRPGCGSGVRTARPCERSPPYSPPSRGHAPDLCPRSPVCTWSHPHVRYTVPLASGGRGGAARCTPPTPVIPPDVPPLWRL